MTTMDQGITQALPVSLPPRDRPPPGGIPSGDTRPVIGVCSVIAQVNSASAGRVAAALFVAAY